MRSTKIDGLNSEISRGIHKAFIKQITDAIMSSFSDDVIHENMRFRNNRYDLALPVRAVTESVAMEMRLKVRIGFKIRGPKGIEGSSPSRPTF